MIVGTIINIALFFLIALLHIYWVLGGKWGGLAAIPQKDNQEPLFQPGPIATLVVALGLIAFALIHLMALGICGKDFDYYVLIGLVGIAIIFLLRFIGDFNYVGLFKKKKDSLFAKNDTKIYTPLCFILFINTLITLLVMKN